MKKNVCLSLAVVLAFLLSASTADADVKLPKIFGDSMVLQQGQINQIWGWAEPGEKVMVSTSMDNPGSRKQNVEVGMTANKDGTWKLPLHKVKADGKKHTITIKGKNTIVLKDVVIGEVWLCSGQSNMQWSVSRAKNPKEEIADANYPNIRIFTVARKVSDKPLNDCQGSWAAITPKNIAGFSAVGYFFGRHLHEKLNVPIGLINSSWGGTLCEAWTSDEALKTDKDFKPILDRGKTFRNNPNQASNLFDGMINPIVPFGIRGAIWYQGESNRSRAAQYGKLFPTMIKDWRKQWNKPEMPFLFVQLAPYSYERKNPNATLLAEVWDSQFKTLKLKNTGMAVTTDIGNIKDIHPKNKQDVGLRLASWALGTTYGKKIVYSGPLYDSMKIEKDGKIRIQFKHCSCGLHSKDGKPLSHFTIAGKDQQFKPAKAVIDGKSIVVSSDDVKEPVAVRFAWNDIAEPNFINKSGWPASPFRTDSFKLITEGKN